jgi:cysteinyl-tRNA synthetase
VALRLYNTLTGAKSAFAPLQPGHVGMYTCGPTVWNFAHVGNLRAFLFYDLVRRHLQVSGFHITHVMNLTDIDDRILDQAMHARTTIGEYVKPYAAAFFEDMAASPPATSRSGKRPSPGMKPLVRPGIHHLGTGGPAGISNARR